MEITNELVDKLALLARLKFPEEEKQAIREDLEKMIRFVDKLNELYTEGVEPLLHMGDEVNQWRKDEPGNMLSKADALKNAPRKDENYFLVPKVIKTT